MPSTTGTWLRGWGLRTERTEKRVALHLEISPPDSINRSRRSNCTASAARPQQPGYPFVSGFFKFVLAGRLCSHPSDTWALCQKLH